MAQYPHGPMTPQPMPAPGGRATPQPNPADFARNALMRAMSAHPALFSGGSGGQLATNAQGLKNQWHFISSQLWNMNHPAQVAAARATQPGPNAAASYMPPNILPRTVNPMMATQLQGAAPADDASNLASLIGYLMGS